MTPAAFRKLALSMPDAVELPHFQRTSFRAGKKIFATMTADGREAMVPVRPLVRCFELLESNPEVFFSYGGWTERHGSLGIRLPKVDAKLVADLVRDAWLPSGNHGASC
jgi:hypothetical protein